MHAILLLSLLLVSCSPPGSSQLKNNPCDITGRLARVEAILPKMEVYSSHGNVTVYRKWRGARIISSTFHSKMDDIRHDTGAKTSALNVFLPPPELIGDTGLRSSDILLADLALSVTKLAEEGQGFSGSFPMPQRLSFQVRSKAGQAIIKRHVGSLNGFATVLPTSTLFREFLSAESSEGLVAVSLMEDIAAMNQTERPPFAELEVIDDVAYLYLQPEAQLLSSVP